MCSAWELKSPRNESKQCCPLSQKGFLNNFLKLEVVDDEWEWFPFARIISHLQRATFNSVLRVVGQ